MHSTFWTTSYCCLSGACFLHGLAFESLCRGVPKFPSSISKHQKSTQLPPLHVHSCGLSERIEKSFHGLCFP